LTVIDVIEDSPADRAGLETGDVLAGVDGVPAAELGLESVRRSFRRRAGTEVEPGIKRGDRRFPARLKLNPVV
jgi:carboxyl-terminal processing protease